MIQKYSIKIQQPQGLEEWRQFQSKQVWFSRILHGKKLRNQFFIIYFYSIFLSQLKALPSFFESFRLGVFIHALTGSPSSIYTAEMIKHLLEYIKNIDRFYDQLIRLNISMLTTPEKELKNVSCPSSISVEEKDQPLLLPWMLLSFSLLLLSLLLNTSDISNIKNIDQFLVVLSLFFLFVLITAKILFLILIFSATNVPYIYNWNPAYNFTFHILHGSTASAFSEVFLTA